MKKRHCSVCGKVGHDARRHTRKNPEFFTDKNGIRHPIRNGSGKHKSNGVAYDPSKTKGDREGSERRENVRKLIEQARHRPTADIENRLHNLDRQITQASNSTKADMKAASKALHKFLAERQHEEKSLREELTDVRKQQRSLYTSNMTTGDKKRVAPRYAALKRREEEILKKLHS